MQKHPQHKRTKPIPTPRAMPATAPALNFAVAAGTAGARHAIVAESHREHEPPHGTVALHARLHPAMHCRVPLNGRHTSHVPELRGSRTSNSVSDSDAS